LIELESNKGTSSRTSLIYLYFLFEDLSLSEKLQTTPTIVLFPKGTKTLEPCLSKFELLFGGRYENFSIKGIGMRTSTKSELMN
jgi:hypothetical protein